MRMLALVLTLTMSLGLGLTLAQDKGADKEKPKDPEGKLKGFLPAGFKKLGLTEKQVQTIYKIQADYRDKKTELTKQLEKLKAEEKETIEKTLTDAQKKELKAIRTGEKK